MGKKLARENYGTKSCDFIPVAGICSYFLRWAGSCAISPDDKKMERRFAGLGIYNAVLLSSIPLIFSGLEKLMS